MSQINRMDRAKTDWRKPEPDVGNLKTLILETLDKEGLGLIALNAAPLRCRQE